MSAATERKCPECQGMMKEIDIIDKTVYGSVFGGLNIPQQAQLEYVVPGAKRSVWTGNLPIEGKVSAVMCQACGRILLYGQQGS
jgi:hypothetical protein